MCLVTRLSHMSETCKRVNASCHEVADEAATAAPRRGSGRARGVSSTARCTPGTTPSRDPASPRGHDAPSAHAPVVHLPTCARRRVGVAGMARCPAGESHSGRGRGRRTVLAVPNSPIVSLRPRTDDDLDLLFAIAADLDTWEERNAQAPRPLTRDRFDALLARAADNESPEAAMSLVIDVDGAAVGSASLFGFDLFARHAEAGISLERNARGRGIGTAALVQLVEYGFVRHNLRRMHLQAIASNIAAIRAYEKAGFVIEGRQRQHAWVRGTYEDIVRMGILRSAQTPSA